MSKYCLQPLFCIPFEKVDSTRNVKDCSTYQDGYNQRHVFQCIHMSLHECLQCLFYTCSQGQSNVCREMCLIHLKNFLKAFLSVFPFF